MAVLRVVLEVGQGVVLEVERGVERGDVMGAVLGQLGIPPIQKSPGKFLARGKIRTAPPLIRMSEWSRLLGPQLKTAQQRA